MGCASSKHHSKNSRCRHCKTPYSSMTKRSFSTPFPREREGYPVEDFTSSMYGSLKFDPSYNPNSCDLKWVVDEHHHDEDENDEKRRKIHDHDLCCIDDKKNDYALEVIEAKAWSMMIDQKIIRVPPKTPTWTPPGEPETINVKELMEDLEGNNSPLRLGNHIRSFSFHASRDSGLTPETPRPIPHENVDMSKKENGNLPNENVIGVLDFNPEVIYAFRKAYEELPPSNPFYLNSLGDQNAKMSGGVASIVVTEEKKINEDVVEEKRVNCVVANDGYAQIQVENGFAPSNGYEEKCRKVENEKVVLYYTSLRGVRKTYEDCCYVKLILKELALKVDERDVSMHSGFKQELRELLGYRSMGGLPKVFVGATYIGGVEEIRRMHEDGKLDKAFEDCERLDDDHSGNLNDVCECCGDIRFVPCETCSGSCKIYCECDEDSDECQQEEHGFQRCPNPNCNENGIVRCPICCSP